MTTQAKSDAVTRSPIHLLHRAGQCATHLFEVEMGDRDLTPRQLAVLVAVSEGEGPSQTQITERTGIDRSTMAGLIVRLQRKRLLQRHRKTEDARTYAINLTEAGHRLLRMVEPVAKRVDERVLGGLSSKHRGHFMEALSTIVDTLQELSSKVSREAERPEHRK